MERSMVHQREFKQGQEIFTAHYYFFSQDQGNDIFYGVGIEKKKGNQVIEIECVEGLSEEKGEVEKFLYTLWVEQCLPVELVALCDDFISEKEYQWDFSMAS